MFCSLKSAKGATCLEADLQIAEDSGEVTEQRRPLCIMSALAVRRHLQRCPLSPITSFQTTQGARHPSPSPSHIHMHPLICQCC